MSHACAPVSPGQAVILPKPASVHGRAASPMYMCYPGVTWQQSRAEAWYLSAPRPADPTARNRTSPTQPRERQPSTARGATLCKSASSPPHPIIHPSASNRSTSPWLRPPTPCARRRHRPSTSGTLGSGLLRAPIGHGSHDTDAAPEIEGDSDPS
ncbi:hypothetical protein BAE44_0022422 [Dichanthelium oligosanthes]|uniref:Uncharacterized protein n=1 Tax=Dichanthelium oligosanthes TaxID=888268 RepID=A0A1E5UUM1_9POAL|nr:hypothetical protein BAE44_0022422 [Dichanthelium oligosanthes]